MRGYDRDEYEDMDKYDDVGEEQEEEEECEEEEEAPQPTQEELEYLELRQRLKDSIRKQIKKESGAAFTKAREERNRLPNDNYGSFFGPSQPVIAQRVIQESRSLLENQHLTAKVSKQHHSNNKSSSSHVGSKVQVNRHPPKVINGMKTKVQMLKNTRDYSFLLSDDAELPVPAKDPPSRNVSVRSSEAPSAQVPLKSKQSSSNAARGVSNDREARKPLDRQMQRKAGQHKFTGASKLNLTSVDSRKQLGSNNGNGPGQTLPLGPKGISSRVHTVPTVKKVSVPGAKSSMPSIHKPSSSKLQSSVSKPRVEQKKDFQESSKGKMKPKQQLSSFRPQVKQLTPKNSARDILQEERPKKKPVRWQSDDEDDDDAAGAISLIRKMFRYNPKKYVDHDDDVSDMEADFSQIQKEEKHSARVARMEDEEELLKIQEEERREQLRKEAKKRKLSQR